MSSSDKAKSKLLDSMRMSKQVSSGAPVAEKSAPDEVAPVKKAAPKKPKAAAKTAAVKKPVIDNFQAAQRVWPD